MEIGQKLKGARLRVKLTQEAVADAVGVSRQTVSNWENNKSYPDIVSVIKLSDLYSVSLDELLKEDENMIKHLDESTNTVKSQQKFIFTVRMGILGELFILSLLLYCIVLWLVPSIHPLLSLLIHILPAVFAQLLMCSVGKQKLIHALPLLATSALAAWGTWLFFTSEHWANATFASLLIDYLSPAIACIIVFVVASVRNPKSTP